MIFEFSQFTGMDLTVQSQQLYGHVENLLYNYEFTGCMATKREIQAYISANWSHTLPYVTMSLSHTLDIIQMRTWAQDVAAEQQQTAGQCTSNRPLIIAHSPERSKTSGFRARLIQPEQHQLSALGHLLENEEFIFKKYVSFLFELLNDYVHKKNMLNRIYLASTLK